MKWAQYDLITGFIHATNSGEAESLPAGRGQCQVPDDLSPEHFFIDVLSRTPQPKPEVLDGD